MSWSLENWQDLLKRLGLVENTTFFVELDERYRARNRFYHNTTHISHCLTLLDEFSHLTEQKPLVEAALWLHDAIYQSFSSKNELKSAELAERMFGELGMKKAEIKIVFDLIMITAHREEPKSSDEKLIVDIDLSILGAEPDDYDIYEKSIRKEYRFVPKRYYLPGRKKLLTSFLDRPQIFLTSDLHDRFEQKARKNLMRAIQLL